MNNKQVANGVELWRNSEQLTIPQYRLERGRIFTFNDMRQFFAHSFVECSRRLESLEVFLDNLLKDEEFESSLMVQTSEETARWLEIKTHIWILLSNATSSLHLIGLDAAETQAQRLADLFDLTENSLSIPDFSLVRQWVKDLKFWTDKGMEGQAFVHLNPVEMKEFWEGRRLAEELQSKIPAAFYDFEEATKCLALERSTACALHLMRVIDTTLNVLGLPLAVDTATCPSWHSFLHKLHTALNTKYGTTGQDGWWKHNEFYRDTMPQLYAIKNAWRNPSFHAAAKYTEEEAREIFDSVKAFVRRLAAKMPITL